MRTRRDHLVARVAVAALAACAVVTSTPAAAVASVPPPSLSVPAASIRIMDGRALWSRRPTTERRIASCVKMLNALTARDRVSMSAVVTVPKSVTNVPEGGVGLEPGQKVTVRQLMNMMLIASANDAAYVLGVYAGGSERNYVRMMNAKAKKLGLKHTYAVDTNGLSKREHSTADDLTVIGRRVMADPELRKIVRQRSVRVPMKSGGSWTKASTNKLLGKYEGMEGIKTGFTNPAGYCLVGAAKRGGVELVSVVLGAESSAGRVSQTRKLLDWGFQHVHMRTLASVTTTVSVTPGGTTPQPKIVAHPSRTVSKALLDHGGPIHRSVSAPWMVRLPVKAGQRVGTMYISQDGVSLGSVPLLALTDVSVPASISPTAAAPVSAPAAKTATSDGVLQSLYAEASALLN